MTRFLFVRHGAIDGLGQRIACRQPGHHLNSVGRAQVARLASRWRRFAAGAIYSSPQPRALETAEALAAAAGLAVAPLADLDELDFGDWTGLTYDELHAIAQWRVYNTLRSVTRIPNGELLLDVQQRIINCVDRLRRVHDGATIALVTHGDVIRAALAYFLGAPLEFIVRFEIGPASVTAVELADGGPRVLSVNENFHSSDAEETLNDCSAALRR
jgi:probable phosphoglycerate mutase